MTTQEIFQNMTKGEWKGRNANDMLLIECADQFDFSLIRPVGISGGNSLKESEANNAAKISAVNNTYGKGINPESVEKMYKTLDAISRAFWSEGEPPEEQVDDLKRMAEEALTAAKLQP